MADDTQARSDIRALLSEHGHQPNKNYGQNFLADPNIVRKIASIAGIDGRKVVEIGAGTGTLTAALAERADHVVAYEIDRHLMPILEAVVGGRQNVELRCADASRLDFSTELEGDGWVLVANLPYNVGTGIVLDALRGAREVERFVVLVQKEVADRLLAEPGSKTYGVPSVIVGLHAAGRIALPVPRQVFEPSPRVDSAVVVLDRKEAPDLSERAIRLAEAGFGQRRKMLRRSLVSELADPVPTLAAAGIEPTSRAEELAPSDYVALAREEQTR
jgi:16S rRNA (adenine1518-N6/adenine1519-N6)-dimethyltransferase